MWAGKDFWEVRVSAQLGPDSTRAGKKGLDKVFFTRFLSFTGHTTRWTNWWTSAGSEGTHSYGLGTISRSVARLSQNGVSGFALRNYFAASPYHVTWGHGWSFLGVLSFLKSWSSPLDQQKKSMSLHKISPKNVWPSPSPLNPSWYYWSLLTGCLCIVTHCHNTVAKRWISLSICRKTILKWCAGDPSNKYYIHTFCQGAHLCQFQSWKKIMLWLTPS